MGAVLSISNKKTLKTSSEHILVMPYTAHRFPENPVIRPELDASILDNLNGPSLIRVPDWLPNSLGRYYLYFAHHGGKFIRLAYADDLHGPWNIHVPGTLQLDQTRCWDHIASPDLHVDHDRRELAMYFHGPVAGEDQQKTLVAHSTNGVDFQASDELLGPPYMRMFQHEGAHYGIAMNNGVSGGGILMRSADGRSDFVKGPTFLEHLRHNAILKKSDRLEFFFSRGEDCPERILMSTMMLSGEWQSWHMGEPAEVMSSETDYEGGQEPVVASSFGPVHTLDHQLRDPGIFEEDGRTYLLYSCGGEQSLGIAELVAKQN